MPRDPKQKVDTKKAKPVTMPTVPMPKGQGPIKYSYPKTDSINTKSRKRNDY